MIVVLLACAVSQYPAHVLTTRPFRIDEQDSRYIARLAWHGRGYETKGPLTIDIVQLSPKGPKTVTSTKVEAGGGPFEFKASSYQAKDTKGVVFVTWRENGGQHDHTQIYRIDPKTMRPEELMEVLYGDVSRLDKGAIVEHSFRSYVSSVDWPKGVTAKGHINIPLDRTWRFDPKAFTFVAGPWRKGT